MTYQLETTPSRHLHNMECPHCKRHHIVLQGESEYVCLNCGWRRDSNDWSMPPALLAILLAILAILLL